MIPFPMNKMGGAMRQRQYRQWSNDSNVWNDYFAAIQTMGDVDFDFYIDFLYRGGSPFYPSDGSGLILIFTTFQGVQRRNDDQAALSVFVRYNFSLQAGTEYRFHLSRRGDTASVSLDGAVVATGTLLDAVISPGVGVAPRTSSFSGEFHRIELWTNSTLVWRAADEFIYA